MRQKHQTVKRKHVFIHLSSVASESLSFYSVQVKEEQSEIMSPETSIPVKILYYYESLNMSLSSTSLQLLWLLLLLLSLFVWLNLLY